MKKNITIILLILISITNLFSVKGSGNIVSEERVFSKFHTIYLNCAADIQISKGAKHSAILKADDNILPLIKMDVKRGELTISLKKIVSDSSINIAITMENINNLNIQGPGNIIVNQAIENENMKLSISGSGSLDVKVKANYLFSRITGSGNITIAGSVDTHETELSAGGLLKALDLNANKTKMNIINGEGTADINTSENFELKVGGLAGNANIRLKGKPELKINVIGAAVIESII